MPLYLLDSPPAHFNALCSGGDSIGDLVHVSGSVSAGLFQVEKIDVTDKQKMPAVGVIVSKINSNVAVVQRLGLVDLSTVLSGLAPGRLCYAGSDGRPTTTTPLALSASPILLQIIGVAAGDGMVELSPMFNMTLVRP